MKASLAALFAIVVAAAPAGACSSSPSTPGGGFDGGSGFDGGGDDAPDAALPPDARPFTGADAGCPATPAWTGNDHVAPSQSPPGGLTRAQVPQFVSIGWDDNFQTDAIYWATSILADRVNPQGQGHACTYDGTQVHGSFYLSTTYITEAGSTEDAPLVKQAWHKELTDGNEMADHTHLHADGVAMAFTVQQWKTELQTCIDWLTKPFDPNEEASGVINPMKGVGVPAAEIVGFRTPYLAYSDATFTALDDMGFHYDCTIEDGYQGDQDATRYFWPYTLDSGSPANAAVHAHPGLWELPVYPVVVPPDNKCAEYGVPTGLRAKMLNFDPGFDVGSGKITGLDYNMWILYKMNKAEFVATLKYTLDQHLAGNRTPFMFGAHPDLYSATTPDEPPPNATYQERRAAIQEFLDYALTKPEVRIVPNKAILDWLRNPSAL